MAWLIINHFMGDRHPADRSTCEDLRRGGAEGATGQRVLGTFEADPPASASTRTDAVIRTNPNATILQACSRISRHRSGALSPSLSNTSVPAAL
jgi:hypothetical protein